VAIASVADGRIVRRLSAIPAGEATDLAASPDGKTLYYVASGTVWAIATAGGEPRKIGPGRSVAVSPDGKYLIVQLQEKNGFRLMEVPATGGAEKLVSVPSDLALSAHLLSPNAVGRDGRVLVTFTAPDYWFYGAAILDPRRGKISPIPLNFAGDVFSPGWLKDGSILSSGWPIKSTLWRVRPTASQDK
jgi:DNA-binding beta-propeller fold protein YncE